MATIGEANSILRLIDWITGGRGPSGDGVTASMARDHAAWLAERAYNTLSAGMRGEQVKERWPAEQDPVALAARVAELTKQNEVLEGINESVGAGAYEAEQQIEYERNRADTAERVLARVTKVRTTEIDGVWFVAAADLTAIEGLGGYAPEEGDVP